MTSNNYHFLVDSKMMYKGSVDSGFQEPIDLPHSSPLTSPVLERVNSSSNINSPPGGTTTSSTAGSNTGTPGSGGVNSPVSGGGGGGVLPGPAPMMTDPQLQQHIASLKHQQQLQQQLLLEQFHQEQRRLAHEHEKQLQEHIKVMQDFMEHQKQIEQHQRMEKEMLEKERLNQIKNKTRDEQSAIASSEVKQRLQEFVLNKKIRGPGPGKMSPPQYRHWSMHGSVDQTGSPQSGLSPPYGPGVLQNYEDDFPLRKTASEPNILKVRSALKQKVLERRIIQSPMMRRRENIKGVLPLKRKPPLSIDSSLCNSSPDSGPNSPPSSAQTHSSTLPNGSIPSLHSKELYKAGTAYPGMELSLYTSPSMPNISLGRPPTSGTSSSSSTGSSASEAELRAMGAARFGLPLTAHMLPAAIPYYPSLSVIDGEVTPPGSPAYMAAQMKALEEACAAGKLGMAAAIGSQYSSIPVTGGISDSQAAHARLHRHRPLGRTQSAPLPLGHPLLQPQTLLLQQQQQQEKILKENQKLYLKQHIRQAVLQRVGSKNHMENVDEETEAKLAQEMKESREASVAGSTSSLKDDKMDDAPCEIIELPEPDLTTGFLHSPVIAGMTPRELKMRHKAHLHHHHHHRPLSRTQSSPLVTFSMPPQQREEAGPIPYRFTTGLAYDTLMQKHQCTCGNNSNHPEHAGRLQSIWARLQETGLSTRCERIKSRKATLEEIQSCHTEAYTLVYGTNPLNRQKLDPKLTESLPMRFCILPCGGVGVDSDTVWNDYHTSNAARMAAGCVTELALRVATGEIKNGMAVVRPPGHHAETQQAMGFCFFNSIAIAATQLRLQLKLERILIVDWDVHHGNSTQQMFYTNPNVLYISIHRHDNGNFFPGTGAPEECGAEDAVGFNVNIAFSGGLNPPMGDAEYLVAFRTLVMPIAREFDPDLVLVSAGFDAALGHPSPLGGYAVSSACFGHMTRELMSLAGGKIVLSLEGGYDLPGICDASEMCIGALLGDDLPALKEDELLRPPCKNAIDTLDTVMKIQDVHWPCIKRYAGTIYYSLMEAQKRELEEADTVSALASLSMSKAAATAKTTTTRITPESEPMEEEES